MSQLKSMLRVLLGLFAGIASLVVMFFVGLVAVGALIVTSLAVVFRIKWLQRKFEKQSQSRQNGYTPSGGSQNDISAVKTEEGSYRVSGT
ncbi:MAG: hypothetical protein ABJO09_13875 [Hyphomicrobiales bacterium]